MNLDQKMGSGENSRTRMNPTEKQYIISVTPKGKWFHAWTPVWVSCKTTLSSWTLNLSVMEHRWPLGPKRHAVHPAPHPLDFELLLRDAADHSGPGTRSRLQKPRTHLIKTFSHFTSGFCLDFSLPVPPPVLWLPWWFPMRSFSPSHHNEANFAGFPFPMPLFGSHNVHSTSPLVSDPNTANFFQHGRLFCPSPPIRSQKIQAVCMQMSLPKSCQMSV